MLEVSGHGIEMAHAFVGAGGGLPSVGGKAQARRVARAREAEVKSGFTKADMLRPAKEDPRAPGGVFERIGALLSDLLDQR